MPATYTLGAALIAAVIAAGMALYYWRRSAGLYALLIEGANRFEEQRQRNAALEQGLSRLEDKQRQHREATASLEAALAEARALSSDLTRRLEAKEHELRVVKEKLELQKGHLEKQLAKAEQSLQLAEEQRVATETRLGESLREYQGRLAAVEQELALKEKDWASQQREMEKERAAVEKKLKTADPTELRRLKRKLAQYDRLYASMKGLREMSEERNRNWEVALRKLSTWILKESRGARATLPEQIGPLVGQALQAIGAQLIDDNEVFSEREGAVAAADLGATLAEETTAADGPHASDEFA